MAKVSDFFDDTEAYEALLEAARDNTEPRSDMEAFVDDMIERWNDYEFDAFISHAQVELLKKLADK